MDGALDFWVTWVFGSLVFVPPCPPSIISPAVRSKFFFLQLFQNILFLLLYYSARQNLQQLSSFEVVQKTLLFILSIKSPLGNIWLLR